MITSEKTKASFAMGLCGKNLAWMLDDGVLTIVGEGEMKISDGIAPWAPLRDSIIAVVIEDSVTSIGEYAFCFCTSLTSVTIPDSVTRIGSGAFYDCPGLTNIIIPDSVTSIGAWAFRSCFNLTNVVIPNRVQEIGRFAFTGCTGLTDVYYAKADWSKIMIDTGNDSLVNGTIHHGK